MGVGTIAGITVGAALIAAAVGLAVYKLRLRHVMQVRARYPGPAPPGTLRRGRECCCCILSYPEAPAPLCLAGWVRTHAGMDRCYALLARLDKGAAVQTNTPAAARM